MMHRSTITTNNRTGNIYRLGIGFTPVNKTLDGSLVTARGLHGILYHVLEMSDRQDRTQEAAWLHQHVAPKPYTLVPFYLDNGRLAGIQMNVIGERPANALTRAWLLARENGCPLALGSQKFRVGETEIVYDGPMADMVVQGRYRTLGMRFSSPTSFKQGPGDLPLPLPKAVFRRPFQVWNQQCRPLERLPQSWLEWCERSLFISKHQIQTVEVRLSPRESITGFVGEVWYKPHKGSPFQRRMLAALGRLATYVGVGRKTTMGLGAVEFLGTAG